MTTLPLWTGFTLGLVGSLHCLGMCGPIALSLPVHQMPTPQKYTNILLYNLGRASTYAGMGALIGAVGNSIQIFGFQQKLSIMGGVLMLLIGMIYFLRPAWLSNGPWGNKISQVLGQQMRKDKSFMTFFSIGVLNGLLPCGMVYMALISAFATGGVASGALLMFFFGLGTLPMMAIIMISGKWVKPSLKHWFKKVMPAWVIVLAILMILRGLNLGIPYISPAMNADTQCVESCCHSM